jgi:uncharacterized membrane protein YdbT with pleckstrin-like domain
MKKFALSSSRKSFFLSYVFALVFGFFIFLFYVLGLFSGFTLYLLSFPAVYLFFLPEYVKISNKYLIKDTNIEEVSGIIIKKRRIIPWNLVSNISMKKGVLGRIFNYGDIVVGGLSPDGGIVMRGISNPENILAKIERKIDNKNNGHWASQSLGK